MRETGEEGRNCPKKIIFDEKRIALENRGFTQIGLIGRRKDKSINLKLFLVILMS